MSTSTITLPPHCALCSSPNNLQRCGRCNLQLYCSRDHQVADRASHKAACNVIARKRTAMETEEQSLRDHPGDTMTPGSPFKNGVGHFWTILETRPYMRARFALVEALQKIKTRSSVEAQRDHLMNLLRLCRGDNLGVRYLLPSLFLRLGQDQECYDFIKWYETEGQKGDYDWRDMDRPYLNIRNSDVFEPVDYLCRQFSTLNNAIAVTLLKIKLLLDLMDLQTNSTIEPGSAIEVTKLRSQIIARNRDIIAHQDLRSAICKLQEQIKKLFKAVHDDNKYIWPAMQHPEEHVSARPNAYSRGSRQEMQIALMYAYEAWKDTPGAIEYIRQMC